MKKRNSKNEEHIETMRHLSGTVVLLRKSQGLSLRELAEKAGISHSDLFRIENGSTLNPSIYLINSIAQALGLSIDELMTFDAVECPTCKGSGWIRKSQEGEGSEGRDITGRTKEDLEALIWEVHTALTQAGEYPNKYGSFREAIEALGRRAEGKKSEGRDPGILVEALDKVATWVIASDRSSDSQIRDIRYIARASLKKWRKNESE